MKTGILCYFYKEPLPNKKITMGLKDREGEKFNL